MKQKFIFIISTILLLLFISSIVYAEDLPAGKVIPKIPKTANDPILSNGHVYPFWGPVCQRYTYSVIYSDKEGRVPKYVKIYFNGEMLDMSKENSSNSDYKKGVKYIYKFVPTKIGSNFYYFEASNGLGKARASIIESPDNGPVLFNTDFQNNEIVLIDAVSGQEVWSFPTDEEWVGGVALSTDGKYLAAQTSRHIYLFDTKTSTPLWIYESTTKTNIGGDVKGGVALSANGDKIFAALNGRALMFGKDSNTPLWTYNLENNGGSAYGVDIAKNGSTAAVAMAGSETDENSNTLLMFNADGKKLWQYHSSGNWHEVNLTDDGNYVVGATGCPDRRGYLFSKDSNKPIFKSEPLSKESPIDEARISSDGSLIAYGVESSYGAVILMDKSGKQIWKYDTEQAKSVRALAMTPDGDTIGAGTFGGDVLLFNRNSNQPVQKININSSIGAFDISDDGSVFATGSADKKLRIFSKESDKAKAEIALDEYAGELDVSANGKYVAAGTAGSVYFFESIIDLNDVPTSTCQEVIEPAKEDTSAFGGQNGDTSSVNPKTKATFLRPSVIFAGAAGLFIVALTAYLIVCWRKKINCKKIYIIISSLVIIVCLGAAYYFWQVYKGGDTQKGESSISGDEQKTGAETSEEPAKDNTATGSSGEQNPASGSTACGNGICEPDAGENKDNCKDCTSSN